MDWYTDRALWRWKPNQNLNNGGKQFLCPQCAGTVDTTTKTRKPRAINSDGPFLALREFVGLWSGWLVVGFMLGGVLGRRSFGGL